MAPTLKAGIMWLARTVCVSASHLNVSKGTGGTTRAVAIITAANEQTDNRAERIRKRYRRSGRAEADVSRRRRRRQRSSDASVCERRLAHMCGEPRVGSPRQWLCGINSNCESSKCPEVVGQIQRRTKVRLRLKVASMHPW